MACRTGTRAVSGTPAAHSSPGPRRGPAEDERVAGGYVAGVPLGGRDGRGAVRTGGTAGRLRRIVARFRRTRHPRIGALRSPVLGTLGSTLLSPLRSTRRRPPRHPAVLVAPEARLAGTVGAPGGRGLGAAAVLGVGRGRRAGRARGVDGVLVEEVRARLLERGGGRGLGRTRAGRRSEPFAVRRCRTAGARYPGGTVPVPDISRNGRVRVIPVAGPVVTGCRGWGAHVRRPVSARG